MTKGRPAPLEVVAGGETGLAGPDDDGLDVFAVFGAHGSRPEDRWFAMRLVGVAQAPEEHQR